MHKSKEKHIFKLPQRNIRYKTVVVLAFCSNISSSNSKVTVRNIVFTYLKMKMGFKRPEFVIGWPTENFPSQDFI